MKQVIRIGMFILAGTLLGLGYYYAFGCSGNCAVTSNPWMTMGYMGVVGGLLSVVVRKQEAV